MSMTLQAVFLVGGFGTRLGALTRDTPKPLMDVAGRPFLSWLAEAAAGQGVRDFLFLSGYRAPQIEAAMTGLQADGLQVRYSVEPEPLGTGGALAFARAQLADTFFLLNGDSLFHIRLADLARPGAGSPPLVRLALRREPEAGRYGSVNTEGERIVGFREKQPEAGAGLINGGVYWMRREVVEAGPRGAFSLERDLFPELATAGRLEGRVYDAPFIDIGVPESLAAAQQVVPQALNQRPG
jgi:NDP-sugar pyrophosphorylase family protein